VGELIAGSDNKVFECIIRIQVRVEKAAVLRTALVRRAPYKLIGSIFEKIFYLEKFTKESYRTVIDQAKIMKREPVFEV